MQITIFQNNKLKGYTIMSEYKLSPKMTIQVPFQETDNSIVYRPVEGFKVLDTELFIQKTNNRSWWIIHYGTGIALSWYRYTSKKDAIAHIPEAIEVFERIKKYSAAKILLTPDNIIYHQKYPWITKKSVHLVKLFLST